MPYKDPVKQRAAQAAWANKKRAERLAKGEDGNPSRRNAVNRNRDYVRGVKDGAECIDCGQPFPYFVLDFDHVRGDKVSGVSTLVNAGVKLQRIKEEIGKCDLVCANCHRYRTFERGYVTEGNAKQQYNKSKAQNRNLRSRLQSE